MRRHYFVQKTISQERMDTGGSDAVDGVYTITMASPGATLPDDAVAGSPPDFGVVNIFQRPAGVPTDRPTAGPGSASKAAGAPGPRFTRNMVAGSDSGACAGTGGGGRGVDKGDNNSAVSDSDDGSDAGDSDIISEFIGHYGVWQFCWTFLLCLFQIPTTFHIFCLVFQAASRDFWCARPDHLAAVPVELWRNLTQPDGQCKIRNAPYDQLSVVTLTDYFAQTATVANDSSTQQLVACSAFEYDTSVFGHTLIAEFGLVCDRQHIMSIVEMCFLAGAAAGSVCSGWISDQFGRRHTLMGFALIQAVTGILLGFASSLELYMTLRVVIGFASMSVAVVSFVLVVELVSGKYRTIIGILNILPVALAYVMAAGIAYVSQEWRTMQFVITAPGAVLLLIWWRLPESPRWLLAKGRLDELTQVIERAAATNGIMLPPNIGKALSGYMDDTGTGGAGVSVTDIFRLKYLRTTLVMVVVWFGIILIYFGITLHLGNLGGDIYLNTVLAGSVESIAICLSIVVVLKLGLRINLFLYMVVAGVSCIAMNFVPDGNLWLIITLAMIVKCAVGACNAIIPTFTAYQYPTTMRNLGVGVGNFAAGVALIIVPYMWLLEHYDQYLPMTVMGVFSIIGGLSLIVLNDKLSRKHRQRCTTGDSYGSGSSVTRSTDDETHRIDRHFPREYGNGGLSNIGFAQNESMFL